MLVEFSVSNFRSILEEQTLSLVANSGAELRDSHVHPSGAPATPDLLRSAVIYGANASGKSNLLLALNFAREFVRDSARKSQPGEPIHHQPHAVGLEDGQGAPASTFRFNFVQDQVRFQYAFSVDRERVVGEWLTAYPEGRPQMWFCREYNAEGASTQWNFGPNLRGQKKVWQEATRPNALYLSTAVQLNAEQMNPVFLWFTHTLRTIMPFARVHEDFTAKKCGKDESWKSQVQSFLARSDLGITDMQVECRQFDPASLDTSMPDSLRAYLTESMKGEEVADVRLLHQSKSGKRLLLDLNDESGGTYKVFALAGPWIDVLANGYVLIIDELDTSLHPQLLRHLVSLFNHPVTNPKGAQLIFSTHDTSLLDTEQFRRDQIWFMEKDEELVSHLYPLTDFSPRKGENLEKGYLQGRYGALPYIGDLRV